MRGPLRIAAMIAAVIVAMPARADMSVALYLDLVAAGTEGSDRYINVYLSGVVDGLLSGSGLASSSGVNFFCVPEGAVLDVLEFRSLIDSQIETLREQQVDFAASAEQMSIGMAGLMALNRAHPCDR